MEDKDTQCKIILVWLKERGEISAKIARQLCGCERLAARINDLRRHGILIKTDMRSYISRKTGRKVRYAVYSLEVKDAQP